MIDLQYKNRSLRIARIFSPAVISVLGLVTGGLIIVLFWPEAALADDCLRDPYNAEDCLRTSGWAPVMAGGVVWLTSIFAGLGEIKNTLAALADRAAAEIKKGGKDIYNASGELYDIGADLAEIIGDEASDQIDALGQQMSDEVGGAYASSVSLWDRFSIRNIFKDVPWYQDTMDKIFGARKHIAEATGQDTSGIEQEEADNKRRTSQGESASTAIRLLFSALAGGLAAVAGASVAPVIAIAAAAFFIPDAINWVTAMMLGRK